VTIADRHATTTATTNLATVSPAQSSPATIWRSVTDRQPSQSKTDHAHHHDETAETIAEEIVRHLEGLWRAMFRRDDQTEIATSIAAAATTMDPRRREVRAQDTPMTGRCVSYQQQQQRTSSPPRGREEVR
jgi:hypothetical protein